MAVLTVFEHTHEPVSAVDLQKILHKQGFNRMFLHAFSVTISHPIDGRRCYFESPVPDVFDLLEPAPARPSDASAERDDTSRR